MNVLYVLVPLALLLSSAFVAAFIWATRDGQWDDVDLNPRKILDESSTKKRNHE